MTRSEDVSKMFHVLANAQRPLTRIELSQVVGIKSKATFYRVLNEVSSSSNREIIRDKSKRPYLFSLEPEEERSKSVPNILLRDKEIEALVVIEQLAESLNNGFFEDTISAFRVAIETKIKSQSICLKDWKNRIKAVPIATSTIQGDVFKGITTSVLKRKQLTIMYTSLTTMALKGNPKKHIISPQTILLYKDNWYMDAYCHSCNEMRTYQLSRIVNLNLMTNDAKHIPEEELMERHSSSYGIFAGKARNVARIKFSGTSARVVEAQEWHPDQLVENESNGSIVLSVPYAHDEELLMDILKWGNAAELLGPPELREKIIFKIENMKKNYE